MNKSNLFFSLALCGLMSSCGYFSKNESLPVYGEKIAVEKNVDGQIRIDSLDYTIPDFNFIDQDSNKVSAISSANKIWVVDFFFTSCPSICPKMKKEMLRVYEKYNMNDNVVILSFSIDPTRDSVARLHAYAEKLGIGNSGKWHMLTGSKDSIYSLAEKFLVSAEEDPDAPGGHVHSGNFILVDKQRRLRGYYDGVKAESVDKMLADMDVLLNEKNK